MNKTAIKKRKRGISAAKRNFYWDMGIGLGFLAVFSQEITGETLHEWLGLALFAGLLAHVIFHWKWIVNMTKRFFTAKLPAKIRLNYLINAGLVGSFVLMGLSGLMISESVMPILGLGNGGGLWESLHEAASNLTLTAVVAHVLLHWKWLLTNGKKYLLGNAHKRMRVANKLRPPQN